MKKRLIYIGSIVFLALYFFLFPMSTGKELYLKPRLVYDSSISKNYLIQDKAKLVSFGKSKGYITPDLKEFSVYTPSEGNRIAASDSIYVIYNPSRKVKKIYDIKGNPLAEFRDFGYPFIHKDRIFSYNAQANRISEYDTKGNLLWQSALSTFVSKFSASDELLLGGMVNGTTALFSKDGSIVSDFRPGGSRIEAVYGAALSHDGRFMSVVSGLDPQRFVILEKREHGYRPLDHNILNTDFRRPVKICFSDDDKRVYFEGENQIHVYSLIDQEFFTLPVSGRLEFINREPVERKTTIVGNLGYKLFLEVLSDKDRRIFYREIPESAHDIALFGPYILLSVDNKLVVLEWVEG